MFVLEHRYYGASHPVENMTGDNMRWLSSTQALEDAAHFMMGMNTAHNLTSWVTFGGSYSGSLSAWARLRFPHLVVGSVSSSSPLFAKLDFSEYLRVVADALDTTGPGCNAALTEALTTVERMVTVEAEWEQLETKFKLCQPLADHHDQDDISSLLELLIDNLAGIVQYNGRYSEDIFSICALMTDESLGTPLDRLAAVNDVMLELNQEECIDHSYESFLSLLTDSSWGGGGVGYRQWFWQTCTEFGWYQTTNQEQSAGVFGSSLPLAFFEKWCKDAYGDLFTHDYLENNVAGSNIEYGGFEPRLSKVVFVHGSIDPWHAMGVLEDLHEAAPAIYIPGTSHCADMYPDSESDPVELTAARERIGDLVSGWIATA